MSWRGFWAADRSAFALISGRVRRQLARGSVAGVADPYTVLGLTPSATADDIKRSFRARAKALHPDANKDDPKATARIAELNSAYGILGNESKREAFDRGDIDGQGKPTYVLLWLALYLRTGVVATLLAGSLLVLLLLFVAKLTPHFATPDVQVEEEPVEAATIQPIVIAPVEHLPILQRELPPATEAARPLTQIDDKQIEFLIRRSQDLISEGDVAAARVLLRRAAEADSARAAITLGATYDPVVLAMLRAYGVEADIAEARFWYTRASELGSQEALARLNLLSTR
jgi:hypothetical protein